MDHVGELSRAGLAALWGATLAPNHSLAHGALPALTVGTTNGAEQADLHLHETIARGGMGWIRAARQPALNRDVVVKSVAPGGDVTLKTAALLKEARVTGRLEHPNIVPVHGLGHSAEHGPMMIMKRIEGASWGALIHEPNHPAWDQRDSAADDLERNIAVLLEVCRAVQFAHSHGVIHRDIKPDNVMVGSFGEVYLVDWGIALEGDGPRSGRISGTPAYMAPEMARPHAKITERTDVFLLGATLHEVLTGRPRNEGEGVAETLEKARWATPYDYGVSVPAELADICNRACAHDPEERFETVDAFRRSLNAFLTHRSSIAEAQNAEVHLRAMRRLIDEKGSGNEIRIRFDVCRFGLERALETWPENEAARENLFSCIEGMALYELQQKNADAALALLADLDTPRPDLEARAQEARKQAVEARTAARTIQALNDQFRLNGLDWGRSLSTLGNGATVCGTALYASHLVRQGELTITAWGNFAYMATGCILMYMSLILLRRCLWSTRLYQQLMLVLVLFGPVLVTNRAIGILIDLPFLHVIALDCIVCIATATVLAATLHPAFWVSTAISIIGTPLALLNPEWSIEVVAVAYMLHSAWIAYVVRPGAPQRRPAIDRFVSDLDVPPSVVPVT